ncbi:6-bladed beta-propeller [Puteibacter caeruleilacunae]|nr:6-bladed beta-propeller [Puteibacter caeruleilacunae]
MMKILISIILIVATVGCIKHAGVIDRIDIEEIVTGEVTNVNILDIAKEVTFIPMETNDTCLVGTAFKVIVNGERCYILDSGTSIKVFDLNDGHFIRQLNRRGRGPGEYIEITDFVLSEDGNSIIVSDMGGRKIIVYNCNMQFVRETKLPFGVLSIALFDHGKLALYSPSQLNTTGIPKVGFLDLKEKKIINEIDFPLIASKSRMIYPCNFNSDNDGLSVKIPDCDTIFSVSTEGLTPSMVLDMDGKELLVDHKQSLEGYHEKRDRYIEWSDFFENDDLFLFTVQHDRKLKRGGVFKESGKTFLLDYEGEGKSGFRYPLFGDLKIWPDFLSEKYCIMVLDAFQYCELLSSINGDFPIVKESDNPVVVRCRMR